MPKMSDAPNGSRHGALLRNALGSLERMQERVEALERERNEPIAVVGLGCRFPGGADDPDAFWDLLTSGTDAVREVPADRWDIDAYFNEDPSVAGTISTREGGFLDEISRFDARFFGISPREARSMDPQQRMILEVAWQALEGAGIPGGSLNGTATGVFVGIGSNDFAILQASRTAEADVDAYTGSGGGTCFAAGRISYALGLQGPSMIVDTACSSSLVAVHLACESLRRGECRTALAAGVNLILSPMTSVFLSRTGALAPDGRCKAFDASADGFGRGEGCGAVVLKRLSDARRDGDDVLAVLRGSAVNQDGKSSGITVPNGPAQRAVIRQALERAGTEPREVGYLEAHGTGTPLGDPIEMGAVAATLAADRNGDAPLLVGSVKTNVGHLEAAAGIAGLIKAVLAVRHGAVPPSLHFRDWNPEISLDDVPVSVPTGMTPWPSGGPRVAGVSSFGLSGTNAHVVVAEPPDRPAPGSDASTADPDAPERRPDVFLLSAGDEAALEALARRHRQRLSGEDAPPLHDVCATLQTGRTHLEHRAAMVVDEEGGLLEALEAFPGPHPGLKRGRTEAFDAPEVAFLFTGQGSQYAGMGLELAAAEPVVRDALEQCHEILAPELDVPLLALLEGRGDAAGLLDETAYTQPALFAVEYALAELWRSWGVEPGIVLGHSIGEYVAACLAGVFKLEDALRLVAARGRLMQSLPPGGVMASVRAPEDRVGKLLPGDGPVAVAAVNGPLSTVISGAREAVLEVLGRLEADGVDARELRVSHAFHSPLMDPILDAFREEVAATDLRRPERDMVSNLTGRLADPAEVATPDYWTDHIRSAVRFGDSMQTLRDEGYRIFLEVGPHPTLTGLGRSCLPEADAVWARSLRRGGEDAAEILEGVADLHVAGVPVDWSAFRRNRPGRRISLPTYPFQGTRYPVVPEGGRGGSGRGRVRAGGGHPFLGRRTDVATEPGTHLWEIELDLDSFPYLDDHRVQGVPVLPATAYMEMAMAAATELAGGGPLVLRDIRNEKVLLLDSGAPATLQLELRAEGDRAWAYRVLGRSRAAEGEPGGGWTLHASGSVGRPADPPEAAAGAVDDLEELRARCDAELSGDEFYRMMRENGNDWGPAFQGVERVWRRGEEAVAEGRPPPEIGGDLGSYVFHPALADATGHVLSAVILGDTSHAIGNRAMVATGIEEVRIHRPVPARAFQAHAVLRSEREADGQETVTGNVCVFDESGDLVAETAGIRFRYLEPGEGPDPQSLMGWLSEVTWVPSDAPVPADPGEPGLLVVLCDDGEIGESLFRSWQDTARSCVVVRTGDVFERLSDRRYRVRPGQGDDLARLFEDLNATAAGLPVAVVSLWALAPPGPEESPGRSNRLEAALTLVQELVRWEREEETSLWLVTQGGQPVGGERVDVDPMQASVWGFGRTVAVEHGEIWGGLVDLSPGCDPAEAAAELRSEVLSPDMEDQIAYRDGKRHVARLRKLPAPRRSNGELRFAEEGTYLITGGFGGIGSILSSWLADRGARHLLLVSRSCLPPRSEWDDGGHDERMRRRIAQVRALEERGVTVFTAAVDVGDREAVQAFLEDFRDGTHPPIRGVFHAAGVPQYKALMDHEPSDLTRVTRSKIYGTSALDREFGDEVDLFVLFSSAASVVNAALMCGYAAGNAYLDGTAHRRRTRGAHGLSVNWGPWAETGMAVDFVDRTNSAGLPDVMHPISAIRGMRALEHLLQQDATQACVMNVDWNEVGRIYPGFAARPILQTMTEKHGDGPASGASPGMDLLLEASPKDRHEILHDYSAVRLADVLGLSVDELDLERPVSFQGFDSMMALELKSRIENDLAITVPLVKILEGPSVGQLAQLLSDQVDSRSVIRSGEAVKVDEDRTAMWEEGTI